MSIIKTNKDGSKWIKISKNLLLFMPYNKIKFWDPKLGIKKFYGLRMMSNCRFKIYWNKQLKHIRFHWFIRLPFFYWERNNIGWAFGFNRCYLWCV